MKAANPGGHPSAVVRRMAPNELEEAIDVWYRSLVGSLSFMRPEQLRGEEAYKGFFRDLVAMTRDLWVAELQSRIAGVLALEGDEIDRLYVAPEAQGQQVGTALLEHAKALHPKGLTLVTHQRNTGARRFYERHGFEARELGMSPPPENEPDVEYVWNGIAEAWLRAWNCHDLDDIMSYYADDATLVSPTAAALLGDPTGEVSGKAALRDYFQRGLEAYPNLRFQLLDTMWGVQSVVLCFINQKGTKTAEFMELDSRGKITRVVANYSA